MFKQILYSAARVASISVKSNSQLLTQTVIRPSCIHPVITRSFTSILGNGPTIAPKLLFKTPSPSLVNTAKRTVTKFSFQQGKRKTVKTVLRRFYRLHWGGWIRTKCGRHKKLWRKSPPRKRRLRQHVFCNATQCTLLDKMVAPYWRKPKYYVNDPYEPFHSREEWKFTKLKPRPYFPPEEEAK
ncbi:39S ribosomal protein L35, mitochondrial [Diabrotica virgifera virgifera]|uniref:Large ribosomal subunit protein bL35m n=1 Tax=Diabrotica virgifera virgifera TaxID=50390 RepID=A0A6P7F5C5_DIAVI|nr:39S ribosomal protein L35, mitochondrial [Diabrotica virgifera virgifera]